MDLETDRCKALACSFAFNYLATKKLMAESYVRERGCNFDFIGMNLFGLDVVAKIVACLKEDKKLAKDKTTFDPFPATIIVHEILENLHPGA